MLYQLSYSRKNLRKDAAPSILTTTRLTIPHPQGLPSLADDGGGGRIRTSEGIADRFTVCSLWPLGNLPDTQNYFCMFVTVAPPDAERTYQKHKGHYPRHTVRYSIGNAYPYCMRLVLSTYLRLLEKR